MKLISRYIFFFLLYFSFLYAQFNVEITDLIEYKMNDKKLIYKITAEKKTINNQNLKKTFLFLNKENLISNNLYYSNGIFETKDMKIEFKKAYFLEGDFVMIDSVGNYKNTCFRSKKTILKNDKLDFEDVFINFENKEFKKLKHTIYLNN